MSDQIERMAKLSGAQERAPKYVVPLLKFNGNTGEFRILDTETKEETPVEKPVSITILKKRKSLNSFSALESFFTNEYNNVNQKVNLYKNVDGTITFEACDFPPNLREKYQQLRTKEILYVLFNGLVHKLEVKGGSLGDFYDYLTALGDENTHTFQVVTELGSEKTQNEAKFSYHKITFTKSDAEVDLDAVEKHMVEVAEATSKVDEYFATKMAEAFRADSSAAKVPSEVDKQFEEMGKVEEEPNVDDIPF